MATGPEHYREAENLLDTVNEHGYGGNGAFTRDLLAAAQVHATLAQAAATAEDRAAQARAVREDIAQQIEAERDAVQQADGATLRDEQVICGVINGLSSALRIVRGESS